MINNTDTALPVPNADDGMTALPVPNVEVVRAPLAAGADPNATNRFGQTAQMVALQFGRTFMAGVIGGQNV